MLLEDAFIVALCHGDIGPRSCWPVFSALPLRVTCWDAFRQSSRSHLNSHQTPDNNTRELGQQTLRQPFPVKHAQSPGRTLVVDLLRTGRKLPRPCPDYVMLSKYRHRQQPLRSRVQILPRSPDWKPPEIRRLAGSTFAFS